MTLKKLEQIEFLRTSFVDNEKTAIKICHQFFAIKIRDWDIKKRAY